MTINAANGTISISAVSTLGVYTVLIIGTLSNSQITTSLITILIDSYPVLNTPPINVSVAVGNTQTTMISSVIAAGGYAVTIQAPLLIG